MTEPTTIPAEPKTKPNVSPQEPSVSPDKEKDPWNVPAPAVDPTPKA
jgi:hypothetical protein